MIENGDIVLKGVRVVALVVDERSNALLLLA